MTKSLLSLVIFFISFLSIYSQPLINEMMEQEDKASFKLEREKWMRDMHLSDPDINPFVINDQLRLARSIKRNNIAKQSNHKFSESELIGKLLLGKWVERGSNNQSGRIHTCDFDFKNETIYAASSGGNIWKGKLDPPNDGSPRWEVLNDRFKFPNVQFITHRLIGNKSRVLVMNTGSNPVWYSDDNGNSWTEPEGLSELDKDCNMKRGFSAIDYYKSIYLLGRARDEKDGKQYTSIYRSTNGGANFSKIYSTSISYRLTDLWGDITGGYKVYFLSKDSIYTINEEGELLLTAIVQGDSDYNSANDLYLRTSLVGSKTHFKVLAYKGRSIFFASDNEGKNWERRGQVDKNLFMSNSFNVSPSNPSIVFLGAVEVHRSTDGGKTFDIINKWDSYYADPENKLHADIPALDYRYDSKSGELLFISTDGGLYLSLDDGRSVSNLSLADLNVSQYYSTYTAPLRPNIVVAGSQDQGMQRTLDAQSGIFDFEQVLSGDYGHLGSSDDCSHLWGVYPGFAICYEDFDTGSKNFKTLSFTTNQTLWIAPLKVSPKFGNVAYLAGGGDPANNYTGNHLWELTYTGNSVSRRVLPYNFAQHNNARVASLAISELNANYMYVMTTEGHFLYSTDGGDKWTLNDQFSVPRGHYFYGSSIYPSRLTLGKVFISGSGYTGVYPVMMSEDNGQSFIQLNKNVPSTLFYDIALDETEQFIFAATPAGPYYFSFADSTWYDFSGLGAPDQNYWTVEYVEELKTVRYGTYGRGIWDFIIESTTGSPAVGVDELNDLPIAEISLSPNPMSSSAKLIVRTSKSALGWVKLFDLEGKEIAQPFDGEFLPGDNLIQLNRFSSESQYLGNSSYLLIVNVGGKVLHRKLVVAE